MYSKLLKITEKVAIKEGQGAKMFCSDCGWSGDIFDADLDSESEMICPKCKSHEVRWIGAPADKFSLDEDGTWLASPQPDVTQINTDLGDEEKDIKEEEQKVFSGEEVAEYFVSISEDETLDGYVATLIKQEDYLLKEVSIKDVLAKDEDTYRAVQGKLYDEAEGGDIESPIIINSEDVVVDGYHRIKAKMDSGSETVQAYVGIDKK